MIVIMMHSISTYKLHRLILIIVLCCSFSLSPHHLSVAAATVDDDVFIGGKDDDYEYDTYDRNDYDDQMMDGWVSTGRNRNKKDLEEFFKPFYRHPPHDEVDRLESKFIFYRKDMFKSKPREEDYDDNDNDDDNKYDEMNNHGDDDENWVSRLHSSGRRREQPPYSRQKNELEKKFLFQNRKKHEEKESDPHDDNLDDGNDEMNDSGGDDDENWMSRLRRLSLSRSIEPPYSSQKAKLENMFLFQNRNGHEEKEIKSHDDNLDEFLRENQYDPRECRYANLTICLLQNGLYDAYMRGRE